MTTSLRTRLVQCVVAGGLALVAVFAMPAHADFQDNVAVVKRSVVAVGTLSPTRNPRFRFLGTGFVAGNGNQVVTNAHVAAAVPEGAGNDEKLVIVTPGTGRVLARPVTKEAVDLDHDLVVLRFEGPPMPALPLGDSSAVRDGQDVALTGFPLGGSIGLTPVTHKGIVSAITPVGQPLESARQLDSGVVRRLSAGGYSVLQLDIVSYPGNSGSPLFDANTGQVLGVLNMVFIKSTKESAITSPSGISYAIPVSFVKSLLSP
ncbi:S1C family serine protease [Zoogloea sp.]|uniref:S1C family serine protease n=1 Tax=Zoogloea sp. TaxID=49181 RepID=UPI0035B05E5B